MNTNIINILKSVQYFMQNVMQCDIKMTNIPGLHFLYLFIGDRVAILFLFATRKRE